MFKSIEVRRPKRMTMAMGVWISLPGLWPPRASGNEGEAGGEGGHENGRQSLHSPAIDGLAEVGHPFVLLQMLDVGHEHDAVARGDAENGDEANERRDAEDAAGDENADHAADERQGEVEHDERGVAGGAEGQVQQEPNADHHRDAQQRDDATRLGRALELAAVFHPVAGDFAHERVHDFPALVHHRGDIAAGDVAHDDDLALDLLAADVIGAGFFPNAPPGS